MQAAIPFPDISPEIFSVTLFGIDFALRWYALAYVGAIGVGWLIVRAVTARAALWPGATAPITRPQIEDLVTWMILGVVLGGRLGFVLFYQPGYYLANPWAIPAVWQGGMAFHGGMLGVALAACLFAWRRGIRALSLTDALALATPPGLLFGRLANFINNELWGRPTDLPWAVAFPGPGAACPDGRMPCPRHPSQLYEAALEGVILGLVLLWLVRRGWLRCPGSLTGAFLAGYGAARFLVEFVRQPDAQYITAGNPMGYVVSLGPLGLTMGQLLSLPMILAGAGLTAWAFRGPRARAA